MRWMVMLRKHSLTHNDKKIQISLNPYAYLRIAKV